MVKVMQPVPQMFNTMMEAQTRYRKRYQQGDIEDSDDESEAIFGARSPNWMTNIADLVVKLMWGC